MSETVYIGLGSNLGDRELFLKQAIEELGRIEGLAITAVSDIYAGPAEGMSDDTPPFLNQVIRTECSLTPEALLRETEAIETCLGRTDKGGLKSRTLDIDIVLFGNSSMMTDRLEIPHPRMLKRAFVLAPLLEIDPDLVHPITGKRLSQYLTQASCARLEVYSSYVARQV